MYLSAALLPGSPARAQNPPGEVEAPEPEPITTPEPAPATPPAQPAPPAASPGPAPNASGAPVQVTVDPGRGFTIAAGELFAATILTRVQIRTTFGLGEDRDPTNETQIRTLRVWFRGHVLDSHFRYGIQLALGANDFEPGNASPIFDAYVELTHLRDLNLRVGQFFVPFDRARTIREYALQSVDRAQVVRELTLDRDVGIVLQSQDLFGEGGRFGYHLGVFAGDGRNRFGPQPLGFLYMGRVFVRPFGGFNDDEEGDLSRSPDPRLMIGAGAAFNQSTDRPGSTTGTPYEADTFDYGHLAADLVLKVLGAYLLAEIVFRRATVASHLRVNEMTGEEERIYAREGWGFLGQVSYNFGPVLEIAQLELWGRYEQLEAIGPTDPRLIDVVARRGRGLGGGANLYFNEHRAKLQLDWAHWFGDAPGPGEHLVRLQLDASF